MKTSLKFILLMTFGLSLAFVTASADEWQLTAVQQPHGSAQHFLFTRIPDETVAIFTEGRGLGTTVVVPRSEGESRLMTRDQGHGQMTYLFERE
jgi:hypothetical protein